MIRGLIGMVHLGPLPGSPHPADLADTITRATSDAVKLADSGFDAILVENFGDAPFYADDVPKVTVASMTRAIATLTGAVDVPVGVNVLRNDGLAAVAIAAATGASFIRINVLSGSMTTDQGPIVGKAAELARLRQTLAPGLLVLADVMVKHATAPPGLTIERAAADLWERSGADGIIVSGGGTGEPTNMEHVTAVHSSAPEAPIYVGSGANVNTVATMLEFCTGIIVGTATKVEGIISNPVDPSRAAQLVAAAR